MAVCCICGKEKEDHLVIMGKSVCSDCEWTILTTKVHEEGYKHCAGQLKKLFNIPGGASPEGTS